MSHDCALCQHNREKKPSWGEGSWQGEPEFAEWRHAGLTCLAHRGGVGAWCGYVAVPPGHPLHGVRWLDAVLDVHGGLTFAEARHKYFGRTLKEGETDGHWYLGFDCSHAGDAMPTTYHLFQRKEYEEHYWTLEEVREETNRLAEQVAALQVVPA